MIVPNLILASGSKWRLDLLRQVGIEPEKVVSPDIDESVLVKEKVVDYSERVAVAKAKAVFAIMPDKIILSADTVASLGRRIFAKPQNSMEAERWLHMFSGRRHRVYTTVCLYTKDKIILKQVMSVVKFKRLGDKEINWYIQSNDWQGKAGGYGVNGLAACFIKWIRGSHSAIAGLPLCETRALLDNFIR